MVQVNKGAARAAVWDRIGYACARRFRHVGTTILLAVGVASACGLAALGMLYDVEQEAAILAQDERIMKNLADSVVRGYETVMLAGTGDIARSYAERLKTVPGISDLRVLRIDGTEAFHDDSTISAVNARFGSAVFPARGNDRSPPGLDRAFPQLQRAITERTPVTYVETDASGNRTVTLLHPFPNAAACQGCHGADHSVRGVLKLTTSLAETQGLIRQTRIKALALVAGVLAAMLALTFTLVKVVVVRRIEAVDQAMNAILCGEFATRAPEQGRDELSAMARSFNQMVENVLDTSARAREEQSLAKALLETDEYGIVIANRQNDVVLVNPAAERILGKGVMRIMADGLRNLFHDPEFMLRWERSDSQLSEDIRCGDGTLRAGVSRIRGEDQNVSWTIVKFRGMPGALRPI